MKKVNAPRSTWKIQRCANFEEMRVQSIRQWQRVSATRRAEVAWEMVKEAWMLKGRSLDELEFQRTLTVLKKA